MKDNFSSQSKAYATYRPTYPAELFDFLHTLVSEKNTAWDCATGNGQVAGKLAETYKKVMATDISANQLANAVQSPNIAYSLQPAEKTNFPAGTFDLVTVGQAIHWFAFDAFYAEVKRVIKPGGVLALIGYGNNRAGDETDAVLDHLYHNILDGCWDAERKYIDDNYDSLPFPFEIIKPPPLKMQVRWDMDTYLGYLGTWSGVQHYIRKNGSDPLELIRADLEQTWGKEKTKTISFPLLLRITRL